MKVSAAVLLVVCGAVEVRARRGVVCIAFAECAPDLLHDVGWLGCV